MRSFDLKERIRNLHLIKYFLIFFGLCLFFLGIIWMIFPIPFGFVLVVTGLVFLSPVPFFKKLLSSVEKRDKSNLLVKVDGKIRRFEESL